jgi:two-component system, chemotaxis family, protein-glutamate methylesterase/glutaminase
MSQYGVLIVDDSRTMRALIAAVLSKDPQLRILGEAADALEAREAVKRLNPDVITLDIEMPKMNGLDFLERLMRLRPTPVVVVSSLTQKGGDVTVRALELGAVDCVAKPNIQDLDALENLAGSVKAAAGVRMQGRERVAGRSASVGEASEQYRPDDRIVAIGSSMGGVEALSALLSFYPENCPPTVITQHMPPLFTKNFAERMAKQYKPRICEATDGARLVPGCVYIAPGGSAHLEVVGSSGPHCRLKQGDLVSGHRPSVDVLFSSVARSVGQKSIGVILTGMGRDGAEGLLAMRSAGAETIGQDEATSMVYGMPRVAFEAGAVARQLPLNAIAKYVLKTTNALKSRAPCQ